MTNVEEILKAARDSYLLIDTNASECEHLRSVAERLGSVNLERLGQVHRTDAAYATAIEDLISLEKEVNTETSEYVEEYRQARSLIQKLPDMLEQNILKRYYLCCVSIKEIAEELHYSERWISYKKAEAITHLQAIVEKSAV